MGEAIVESSLPFVVFIGVTAVVLLVGMKWANVVSFARDEQWREQRQTDMGQDVQIVPTSGKRLISLSPRVWFSLVIIAVALAAQFGRHLANKQMEWADQKANAEPE